MKINNIKEQILDTLKTQDNTIISLCEKLGLDDEYTLLPIIAELESDNKISLKGFKEVYREDGGCIHLNLRGCRVADTLYF